MKTIPGTYMRPNGYNSRPTGPPNNPLGISKGIRAPIAGVINPPGAADQVLVAKAPMTTIPMFSKNGSLLVSASSIKNVMKKEFNDKKSQRHDNIIIYLNHLFIVDFPF